MKLKQTIIILFFSLASIAMFSQVSDSERSALISLYNATNGGGWSNNTNWNTSEPVSTWYGITVTDNKVSAINLSDNNLNGSIPSDLGNLTKLHSLVLSKNSLSNVVPSGLLPDNNDINVLNLWIDISENRFVFKDIETNFNSYFRDPYGYRYSPQAKFDSEETVTKNLGDSHTFTTSLTSTNNNYQWYKDGVLIEGATQKEYNIASVSATDAGNYYVTVTNTVVNSLTLERNPIRLEVNTDGADVSKAERDALIAFYNATNGTNWTNNTNWNTNEPVNTWFGVTVENGSVTELNLANNKLQGYIPTSITNLSNVSKIFIQGNKVRGKIPDLTSLPLTDFVFNDNRFIYLNFENQNDTYKRSINNYVYADQKKTGVEGLSVNKNLGENFTFRAQLYSQNNTYQWYKNNEPIANATQQNYVIADIKEGDIGSYHVVANNSVVTDLTIEQYPLELDVNVTDVSQIERDALIALYNATNGPNWKDNTNWLTDEFVSKWKGVTVERGHVVALNLEFNNLSGDLPNSIGNLSFLRKLELDYNEITTLPNTFNNLNQLTHFTINRNKLSGGIPDVLISMTNLTTLGLSENQFSGIIRPDIGNLINLKVLFLSRNRFTGTIPATIGNLINLNRLDLNNNQLSGQLPIEIGNMSSITFLNLENNSFEGVLPLSLGNLTNLNILYLENNKFSGEIPVILSQISNFKVLDIKNNNFKFSDFEDNFTSFQNALNRFEYSPQKPIDNSELVEKKLGENYTFTTSIIGDNNNYQWYKNGTLIEGATEKDYTISNLEATDEGSYIVEITNDVIEGLTLKRRPINLSVDGCNSNVSEEEKNALIALYNSTNGANWTNNTNWNTDAPVCDWFGVTVEDNKVTKIDFTYSNNLVGTIPAEIGSLINLEYLNIASNQGLIGEIPIEIGNLISLKVLRLPSNKLSGVIPEELSNLQNLEELYLGFNEISGLIPSQLGTLSKLARLSLSSNNLQGTIPKELGNLTNLNQLNLNSNQLTGQIPTEFSNLTNLSLMNLADNNITGTIPDFFQNLPRLRDINLSKNELTSPLPGDLLSKMTWLFRLDLSSNNFSGTIPTELGNLTLLRYLFLSDNNLEGTIPVELGNMNGLYTLDLSRNNLEGTIPNEIGNLSSLLFLYLYSNKLEGKLPTLRSDSRLREAHFSNNKFVFSDIKSEYNRYKTLNKFTYTNQAKVGEEEDFDLVGASEKTLSVNLSDPDNKYQWYKDGNIINGATKKEYVIENASLSDIGKYYCQITNNVVDELILIRSDIIIKVDGSGCNITEEEKNALIALYNATDGENWTRNENWLSDKSVCEWEGVGELFGRSLILNSNKLKGALPPEIGDLESFAFIVLAGNDLVGSIPLEVANLKKLQYLLLSNNKLSGSIPKGLESIESFKQFNIINNNYNFSNIEPIYTPLKEKLEGFYYSPQNEFNTLIEEEIVVGSSYTMKADLPSDGNTYQWYKDGTLIPNATSKSYTIENATIDDAGVYYALVKNVDAVPDLELKRKTITVSVVDEINCQESDVVVTTSTVYKCINSPLDFEFFKQQDFQDADYTWTFYDLDGTTILNTSTKEKPSFTYSAVGEYLVKLQVNHVNGCNYGTAIFSIEDCVPPVEPVACDNCNSFKPVPGKTYIISGWVKENREILCSPGTITSLAPSQSGTIEVNLTPQGQSSYINIEQSIDQVNWSKYRQDSPSGNTFNVEPLRNGIIYFRFNSEYCEEYSDVLSVDYRPPTVTILSPGVVSANEETAFGLAVSGSDSEVVNWTVNFGDGTIINGNNTNNPLPKSIRHTYTSLGIYQMTFTITNQAGFTASTTKQISVIDEFLTLNKLDGAIRAKPGDIVYIKANISEANRILNQLTINVKASENGPNILTEIFFNQESVTQFVMPSSGVAYLTADFFVEPDPVDPTSDPTGGSATVRLSLDQSTLNTTPFNLRFTLTGDGDLSKFPTLK